MEGLRPSEDDSTPEDHSGCVVFFIFGVIMFAFFALLVGYFLNNLHM